MFHLVLHVATTEWTITDGNNGDNDDDEDAELEGKRSHVENFNNDVITTTREDLEHDAKVGEEQRDAVGGVYDLTGRRQNSGVGPMCVDCRGKKSKQQAAVLGARLGVGLFERVLDAFSDGEGDCQRENGAGGDFVTAGIVADTKSGSAVSGGRAAGRVGYCVSCSGEDATGRESEATRHKTDWLNIRSRFDFINHLQHHHPHAAAEFTGGTGDFQDGHRTTVVQQVTALPLLYQESATAEIRGRFTGRLFSVLPLQRSHMLYLLGVPSSIGIFQFLEFLNITPVPPTKTTTNRGEVDDNLPSFNKKSKNSVVSPSLTNSDEGGVYEFDFQFKAPADDDDDSTCHSLTRIRIVTRLKASWRNFRLLCDRRRYRQFDDADNSRRPAQPSSSKQQLDARNYRKVPTPVSRQSESSDDGEEEEWGKASSRLSTDRETERRRVSSVRQENKEEDVVSKSSSILKSQVTGGNMRRGSFREPNTERFSSSASSSSLSSENRDSTDADESDDDSEEGDEQNDFYSAVLIFHSQKAADAFYRTYHGKRLPTTTAPIAPSGEDCAPLINGDINNDNDEEKQHDRDIDKDETADAVHSVAILVNENGNAFRQPTGRAHELVNDSNEMSPPPVNDPAVLPVVSGGMYNDTARHEHEEAGRISETQIMSTVPVPRYPPAVLVEVGTQTSFSFHSSDVEDDDYEEEEADDVMKYDDDYCGEGSHHLSDHNAVDVPLVEVQDLGNGDDSALPGQLDGTEAFRPPAVDTNNPSLWRGASIDGSSVAAEAEGRGPDVAVASSSLSRQKHRSSVCLYLVFLASITYVPMDFLSRRTRSRRRQRQEMSRRRQRPENCEQGIASLKIKTTEWHNSASTTSGCAGESGREISPPLADEQAVVSVDTSGNKEGTIPRVIRGRRNQVFADLTPLCMVAPYGKSASAAGLYCPMPTCPVCYERLDVSVSGMLTQPSTCWLVASYVESSARPLASCQACKVVWRAARSVGEVACSNNTSTGRHGNDGGKGVDFASIVRDAVEYGGQQEVRKCEGQPSVDDFKNDEVTVDDPPPSSDTEVGSSWLHNISAKLDRLRNDQMICPYCPYTGVTDSCAWLCLVCGHTGCGRYKRAHALRHASLSGHRFCLQLSTGRIWDYLRDVYVHRRLVQTLSRPGRERFVDVPLPHPADVEVGTGKPIDIFEPPVSPCGDPKLLNATTGKESAASFGGAAVTANCLEHVKQLRKDSHTLNSRTTEMARRPMIAVAADGEHDKSLSERFTLSCPGGIEGLNRHGKSNVGEGGGENDAAMMSSHQQEGRVSDDAVRGDGRWEEAEFDFVEESISVEAEIAQSIELDAALTSQLQFQRYFLEDELQKEEALAAAEQAALEEAIGHMESQKADAILKRDAVLVDNATLARQLKVLQQKLVDLDESVTFLKEVTTTMNKESKTRDKRSATAITFRESATQWDAKLGQSSRESTRLDGIIAELQTELSLMMAQL